MASRQQTPFLYVSYLSIGALFFSNQPNNLLTASLGRSTIDRMDTNNPRNLPHTPEVISFESATRRSLELEPQSSLALARTVRQHLVGWSETKNTY